MDIPVLVKAWYVADRELVRGPGDLEQSGACRARREITYLVGEVRFRLGDQERVTVFLLGPLGSRPLLGAVTLEQFGMAADPVNRRLIRVPALLV